MAADKLFDDRSAGIGPCVGLTLPQVAATLAAATAASRTVNTAAVRPLAVPTSIGVPRITRYFGCGLQADETAPAGAAVIAATRSALPENT